MKKFLLILLILGGAGYGGYYLYGYLNVTTVDVTGKVMVSQIANYDVDSKSNSSSTFDAVVKGVAKNNTKKPLKNVFIKFKIADETTSATIFDLGPGEMTEFTTKSVRTDRKNPEYSFDGILYDETTM